MMSRKTVDQCLAILEASPQIHTVDVTGKKEQRSYSSLFFFSLISEFFFSSSLSFLFYIRRRAGIVSGIPLPGDGSQKVEPSGY